jgi:hypothetical protein
MLRTFADVRGANALPMTALAIETPLAVESVEYASPVAAPSTPELPNGTALSVPAPPPAAVPEKGMRRMSSAAQRRYMSELGAPSSAESIQLIPVVSASPSRRSAPTRGLVQPRLVCLTEALVEVGIEWTKTEGERARGGSRSDTTGERRRGA